MAPLRLGLVGPFGPRTRMINSSADSCNDVFLHFLLTASTIDPLSGPNSAAGGTRPPRESVLVIMVWPASSLRNFVSVLPATVVLMRGSAFSALSTNSSVGDRYIFQTDFWAAFCILKVTGCGYLKSIIVDFQSHRFRPVSSHMLCVIGGLFENSFLRKYLKQHSVHRALLEL